MGEAPARSSSSDPAPNRGRCAGRGPASPPRTSKTAASWPAGSGDPRSTPARSGRRCDGVQSPPWRRGWRRPCLTFVSDKLADGRAIRILTVIDQFTRECVWLEADRSMNGPKVVVALRRAIAQRGAAPDSITLDNGSEFACGDGLVAHAHFAVGGRLIRIASMFPPVFNPKSVPRS